MIENAKWIWVDEDISFGGNKTAISIFDKENIDYEYMVAEFKKEEKFDKKIRRITVEISADVRFWLYINGEPIGVGPVCAGGDYANIKPMPYTYFNTYELEIGSNELSLYAMVQNKPTVQCDMSCGKCGFVLACEAEFEDGTKTAIYTDETWLAGVNSRRKETGISDFTVKGDMLKKAVCVKENVWHLRKSPLKNLSMEEIIPKEFESMVLEPGEERELHCELEKIYACYYNIEISEGELYDIEIRDYERYPEKAEKAECIKGGGPLKFRGLEMRSVGAFVLKARNKGNTPLKIDKVSIIFSHYPITEEGSFRCSDDVLTKIYDIGKWALNICKQTIELDSPNHQENLGCAGDYHIASLMNYFAYGDTELTRLDIIRIADYLKMSRGYMFHTTYSMIWILMLYEYYKFTADKEIFKETKDALLILLERFEEYMGKNGVIDNPPSYMFVDWLIVDGFSMHHPPMCMGQSVLNAFYYGGLKTAVKIFGILEDKENEEKYSEKAEKLYVAFNECFYDKERQLYFDGMNDNYEESFWIPKNSNKKYFSWHTNSLAALFELAPPEKARNIMEKILNDMTLINPQPYFMHFVLEAVYKTGLFEKYGLRELRRWECMTDFEKGLQEGWYAPGDYKFDYSHVWCGTPTYQLPSKIMGFEMIEPGFKKIRLTPHLYGLKYAEIDMPTPYGHIKVKLKKDKAPEIECSGKIKRNSENEYIIEFEG